MLFSVFFAVLSAVWAEDESVAPFAGSSEHIAEETRGWGQTALGEQTREAAAG